MRKYNAKQILEVGNVLSHYFPLHHDVVDKHETGINVLNKDIVEFQPEKKYDLIISISTLEHIGFNEEMYSLPESAQEVVPSPTYVARPEKILRVIQHLKRLLSDDGKIIVTIPWGFNKALDQLLKDDSDVFTSTFYVKRISETNRWVETEKELILNAKYHSPFPFANVLVIGVFQVP
ncbi:MAG: hypothetical protein ACXV49_06390 [Halobacteriota archaeon]